VPSMGKTNQPANFTQTMSPIGARKLRNAEPHPARNRLGTLGRLGGRAISRKHGLRLGNQTISCGYSG